MNETVTNRMILYTFIGITGNYHFTRNAAFKIKIDAVKPDEKLLGKLLITHTL